MNSVEPINDSQERRTKIFSYFYGKNTIFQQFLIVAGILLILLSTLASRADVDPFGTFLLVIGILVVSASIIWLLLKHFIFNKEGELEYDEELLSCIEKAKEKGLEKLNIISDQVERVEPVVLNGVAYLENASNAVAQAAIGPVRRLFAAIVSFALRFDMFVLGVISAAIYYALCMAITENSAVYILMVIIALGGLGFAGYLLYKKFEVENFIFPWTFKRLEKMPPNLISKLGSDDDIRVSLPAITIYMFGDDQLYMYCQYIDIITGKIFYEGTHEYFYEDIVGINASQEAKMIFKRYGFLNLFLKKVDYLKESITVVTSGCKHNESYIVDIGNSLLDTQFTGMRNLIRQKKAEK